MKASTFRRELDELAQATGRAAHTFAALWRTIMPHHGVRTAENTVAAAVRDGVLIRACKGVYVHRYARKAGPIREEIVLRLRPRHFNYVSLETALSFWGLIEQEALGALTVMTTGRSLRLDTPFGSIDLTHTDTPPAKALGGKGGITQATNRERLPWAMPRLALADLRRVGRNLDLVDVDELPIVEREIAA